LPKLLTAGVTYGGHTTRHWVAALDDPDLDTRREAIHALGSIGTDAEESIPALSTILLQDPDRGCRIEAALALMKMCPASRVAVPALARALTDDEPVVRMDAAIALVRLQADGRPAVPALIAALKDERNKTNASLFLFTIREKVAMALGRASAGTGEGVPALRQALKEADTEPMLVAVIQALGDVGPQARAAVPELRSFLQNNSTQVRKATEESLQDIGGS
jgi:HEAT repeat protein